MAKMSALGDKSPQSKKPMPKKTAMRSESHNYDSNRPKRQVVSRYK